MNLLQFLYCVHFFFSYSGHKPQRTSLCTVRGCSLAGSSALCTSLPTTGPRLCHNFSCSLFPEAFLEGGDGLILVLGESSALQ